MEPATIIGTTSAILSFVQFSAKVISTAIEIRDNAGHATKSNQELGVTLKDFNTRLATLRSQNPTLCGSSSGLSVVDDDAQMSLLRCANKCEDLGSKIEVLLRKTEGPGKAHPRHIAEKFKFWKSSPSTPNNAPSNPQGKASPPLPLKASFNSLWLEKDIKFVREQWEQCVRDFNISFMRLDTQTRFRALQRASDDNSVAVEAIQSDLHALCKNANLQALGSFLDDYITRNSLAAKENRNCEYILSSLEFSGMDARRDQIQDAERKTFEWLLEQDSIPVGQDDLNISLKEWLSAGRGVYHITGKPGSGKSTLMKLVGKSNQSNKYLQGWACRDQKQLISTNFFAWKAADSNRLQNKMEGMIRMLLHQVLTHEPGLISTVFPKHWHPETFHANSAIKETKLTWQEIQEGSERFFGSPNVMRKYRVFLLIDGLDEFNDDGEHHFRIAERIAEWCRHNPDNVKACVSSREDNPFVKTFSKYQRLRLHLITSEDIRKLTEQRLMEYPHFASSSFTHKQRANLINSITRKAEGVFLWVVLTIVELAHHLEAQEDFKALHRVVEDSYQNLDKFIKEIVSRIPPTYIKDAQNLFRIVQFTTQRSFEMDLFHLHRAVAQANLNEGVNHGVTYEEAVKEVETFKSQLPVISRGLLELTDFSDVITSALTGPPALFSVSFIHRSVFDFFEENKKGIWNKDLADNAPEVMSLIIQSSAHIANTLTWQQPKFSLQPRDDCLIHWRRFVRAIVVLLRESKVSSTTAGTDFAQLKALDTALLHKQCFLAEEVEFDSSQWSDVTLPPHLLCDTASIFIRACTHFGSENSFCGQFVSWAVKGGYPDWFRHPAFKAQVVQGLLSGAALSIHYKWKVVQAIHPDFLEINEVLDANIFPRYSPFSSNLRGSLWLNFLVYIIEIAASIQPPGGGKKSHFLDEEILSVLLKFLARGVEPYILFHWRAKGTNAKRSDCRLLDEDAENGTRVISLNRPSATVTENAAGDSILEESTALCSKHSPQDDGRQMTAAIERIPLDPEFVLEVTVGTAPTRQLSPGHQWPDIRDTWLMQFLFRNFEATTGTASQVDILKVILSIFRNNDGRRYAHEANIQRLDWAITALSQAVAQDPRPEISESSVDSPGTLDHNDTTEQDTTGTGLDQAKHLHMLTFKGLFRECNVLILPVLALQEF